jgi:hypothetical protein
MNDSAARRPLAGSRLRLSIIGCIALATGHHFRNARSWFTRNPMMKTTNGPSTAAVNRPGITAPISNLPFWSYDPDMNSARSLWK